MRFRFTLFRGNTLPTGGETPELETLSGWENAGLAGPWTLGSTPNTSVNSAGGISDYLVGEINTVTGFNYDFTEEIEIIGAGSGVDIDITWMILDAGFSILASQVFNYTSHGVKTESFTLNPSADGIYLGVTILNNTPSASKTFYLNSALFTGTNFSGGELLEISEPDGWKDATFKLTRDKDFHSLVEYFDGSFIFYGDNGYINGGLHTIKLWEREDGPDAQIGILIEFTRDGYHYFTAFIGQLDISLAEEMQNNKIRIPIIRDDFWAKFMSRKDTPVDLQALVDLDGADIIPVQTIDLNLLSQVIRKTTNYKGFATIGDWDFDASGDLVDVSSPPATVTEEIILWTQATTILESSEIPDSFELVLAFQDTEPIINIIEVVSEQGDIDLEWGFRFAFSIDLRYIPESTDATMINDVNIATQLYYRINEGSLILLETQGDTVDFNAPYAFAPGVQKQLTGNFFIDLEGSTLITVEPGDQIFFYAKHTVTFTYLVGDDDPNSATWISRSITGFISNVNGGSVDPYVNFLFRSIFRDTVCPGFLIHDSAAAILKSYGLGVDNPFYSEHFGGLLTNARQYDSDGCMWNHANAKGLHVRGYTLAEKSYFMSFMQWWRGVYPIFNVGLSYEERSGDPITGFTPDELPPLNFWSIGNTSSEPMTWTGGIANPFLTILTGVSAGGLSDFFMAAGMTFEAGQTYKYSYTMDLSADFTGVGNVHFRIHFCACNLFYAILEEFIDDQTVLSTFPTGSSAGTFELVWPAGADRLGFFIEIVNGTTDDALVTITSVTDETETIPDSVGGTFQVIEVEDIAEYYDEDFILELSNIRTITRNYDTDKIYNKIEIGYTEWKAEAISGIDDPQTKHTYATRFQKIGQSISLLSEWIAASITWEETRRSSVEKSKDYKFDDNTFIVRLNPNDISPDSFVPEFDENFASVTNLFNSDKRYNIGLSVAHNFLRFRRWFNGCLQSYVSSVYKFVSGEGNYKMTSQMYENSPSCSDEDYEGLVLAEDQNIAVTDEVIHLINHYSIEHSMAMSDYLKTAAFRKKAIGISLTEDDHKAFFIEDLSFKPVKGTVTITGWTKEFFDIHIVEGMAPTQICLPTTECDNALTDQLEDILTDENGVCLTF